MERRDSEMERFLLEREQRQREVSIYLLAKRREMEWKREGKFSGRDVLFFRIE